MNDTAVLAGLDRARADPGKDWPAQRRPGGSS
jgi:hypothetical protein